MSSDIQTYMQRCQDRVDAVLASWLDHSSHSERLSDAMRYATLNGGKRIRPTLAYATAETLGAPAEHVDAVACAIELVHSYSLVHDDLPSMDDDRLRRGKPTCHIAFDEATAILAGDSLQPLAFEVLTASSDAINASQQVKLVQMLAIASGTQGMAAGQALDLAAEGRQISLEELEIIHQHKTGKLISASVAMAACACRCEDPETLCALDRYASAIGLAFQVQDDILDVVSDTETLGKAQGADQALNKSTYPGLLGLAGAREKAQALHEAAINALSPLDQNAERLAALSQYIVDRSH